MIHIEGMGWFGSITALALEREGLSFTWSDIDTPHQAWRASTGIVYPAGDDRSEINRKRWQRWVMAQWLPKGTAKIVQYHFAHKKPPHDSVASSWLDNRTGLRVSSHVAVAVDVQAIVHEARSRFADYRLEASAKTPGTPTLIAHGHARAKGWVWGWSRKVALQTPDEVIRAVYYGKRHRFDLTYAYPVASEDGWWYAGSALVNEKRPRVRSAEELETEWARWCEAKAALFPTIKVIKAQPFVQGWRPKPAPGDDGQLIEEAGNRLVYPALWHSGVRWAPTLVEQATAWAASFR